jgi:hypothetical protein
LPLRVKLLMLLLLIISINHWRNEGEDKKELERNNGYSRPTQTYETEEKLSGHVPKESSRQSRFITKRKNLGSESRWFLH